MMATGAPLRLALSDGPAFKALIEDRPRHRQTNSVVGLGGSGAETGESPRQLFSRLVENKKQQLMQARRRVWANWKPIARPARWWRKKIPNC